MYCGTVTAGDNDEEELVTVIMTNKEARELSDDLEVQIGIDQNRSEITTTFMTYLFAEINKH